MATLDLTKTPLFDDLLSFQIEGVKVDLHNDYDCRVVLYNKTRLSLSFVHSSTSHTVKLLFEDAVLCLFSVDLGIQDSTLDLFYRGRFEEQKDVLSTYDQQGRGYFYLSFDNESEIQLLASSVIADLI